jgi:uncharacterized protein (TIRG00374 family)
MPWCHLGQRRVVTQSHEESAEGIDSMAVQPQPSPAPVDRTWWHYGIAALGLISVVALALCFAGVEELWQLLTHANLWWLAGAVLFKLLTPFGTAAVYQRVLRPLGYRVSLRSLWLTAQVAIFVNVTAPLGPIAMSAFLLYAFRRRGIPEGATTLAAALDGLTYELAFLSMVAFGLGYLFNQGELTISQIREVALLALALVLGGVYLWGLQRDRDDLTRTLVRVQSWLARKLHRRWSQAGLLSFIDELYRGKALLIEHPSEFVRLLLYQIGMLMLDVLTLDCAIRALGSAPHFSSVVLGYVLATFFASVAPLPGGGGVYEATLVLTLSRLGVPLEAAIGATLIYRVLTFWLPMLLSAATYQRLLGPRAASNPADGRAS